MAIIEGSELYHCMYISDEEGVADIYEVQLIEPIPQERIPVLRKALKSTDLYTVYQATLVLSSWADPKGLEMLEQIIDNPPSMVLDPDRLSDQDRSLDILANALNISHANGNTLSDIFRVYKKLLKQYHRYFFQGLLADSLEQFADHSLLQDITDALENSYPINPFKSSALLPTIARLDQAKGWDLSQRFMKHDGETPNPVSNVAAALLYIDRQDSLALQESLSNHPDPAVTGSLESARSMFKVREQQRSLLESKTG